MRCNNCNNHLLKSDNWIEYIGSSSTQISPKFWVNFSFDKNKQEVKRYMFCQRCKIMIEHRIGLIFNDMGE